MSSSHKLLLTTSCLRGVLYLHVCCMYVCIKHHHWYLPALDKSLSRQHFPQLLTLTIEQKLWTRLWNTHTFQREDDQPTSLGLWLSWPKHFYQHFVKSICLPTLNKAVWIAGTKTAFLNTYTKGQRQLYCIAWTEKLQVHVSRLQMLLLLIAAKVFWSQEWWQYLWSRLPNSPVYLSWLDTEALPLQAHVCSFSLLSQWDWNHLPKAYMNSPS